MKTKFNDSPCARLGQAGWLHILHNCTFSYGEANCGSRYLWEILRDSFPTPCCKTHWTNKERAQCQQGTHHCSTYIPSYNMILWQAKLLRGPQQRDKEASPAGGWWRSVSWLLASIIMTPPPAAATPGHVPRDTCCSVRGGNHSSRLYHILFPELQRLDNKYRKHNICIM